MERGGENTNRKNILIALSVSIIIALLAAQTYGSVMGHAKLANATSGTTTTASTNGTISVEGNGQVSIQPDRGIVSFGIVTQGATARVAVQSNANISNAVISGLNGIGIENSSIQTVAYSIYPQENYNSGVSTIIGYEVTDEFQVTIIASGQTLAQLGTNIGRAIDVATSNGANQIYELEFTAATSAIQQAQQTALQQASTDASQKAHTIASALGVSITGVVSVTTNPGYYPEPVFFGAVSGISFGPSAATPVLPPQNITITATVQAVFAIS